MAGGFTRDLSASGMYVICGDAAGQPRVGDEVTVEVLLPSPTVESSSNLKLKSIGRVLRLSSPKDPAGFAALAWFEADDSM